MIRRERLKKIVAVMQHIIPEEALLKITPNVLEHMFYALITEQSETITKYLQMYASKRHNILDTKLSSTEKL